MTRPSLWRRLTTAAVLAVVTGSVLVDPGVAGAADPPGPAHAVLGVACPDVMVVAARGSSESPQGDGRGGWAFPDAYTADAWHGAGQVNTEVFEALRDARPRIQFSLDSVIYPANAVPRDFTHAIPFLVSTDEGRDALFGEVARVDQVCGGSVRFVFTGYSQGAWVVHKALWRLAAERPDLLGKTAGVALFGDPLFMPQASIVRDSRVGTLLWQGAATNIDFGSVDVPPALRAVTGSYCLPNDPICQTLGPLGVNLAAFGACEAVAWTPGLCAHTNYGSSAAAKTGKAAAFLAGKLPTEYTKTVNSTLGSDFAGCRADNIWLFELRDVGGSTGITPPLSITARTAAGGTVKIPWTRTNPEARAAYYEYSGNRKLTGDATAEISRRWAVPYPWFGLGSGPCTQPTITISAAPAVTTLGGTVTFTGRLLTAAGRPLAGQDVRVSWGSTTRAGKGQQLGPYRTDAHGRFTGTVVMDDAGSNGFYPMYRGSGPTAAAQFPTEATQTTMWALPPTVPTSVAGAMASSSGTTFPAGSRRTVLSGSGFLPYGDIGIVIYGGSGPQLIATTTSDPDGAFSIDVTIPRGTGARTLVAIGGTVVDDELSSRFLALPVTLLR